jgi:tetratricopeptide (TPR) repeat protein
VGEQDEEKTGNGRLTLALGVVFAFLFAITWSLPSGFGWAFLPAAGYCFFLYWYRLPKRQEIRLEVEDEQGRRFEYQGTTIERRQAFFNKVVRLIWIGGLSIFSFLLVIGFFSSKDQSSQSEDSGDVSFTSDIDQIEAWNAKGYDFYRSQEYDSALYIYEKVLGLDSRNATAWYSKGLVYYDQQRMDKALESFSKAYEGGMRDAFLSHVLGYLNDNSGNYSRALAFYKEAVGMDSTLTDIYARLAELEPSNASTYQELEARFKN